MAEGGWSVHFPSEICPSRCRSPHFPPEICPPGCRSSHFPPEFSPLGCRSSHFPSEFCPSGCRWPHFSGETARRARGEQAMRPYNQVCYHRSPEKHRLKASRHRFRKVYLQYPTIASVVLYFRSLLCLRFRNHLCLCFRNLLCLWFRNHIIYMVGGSLYRLLIRFRRQRYETILKNGT